jgi:PucR family transcriptional regulator, purine catabolism regulatory protein
MEITLKHLIDRNVFEKIEIHSGANQLHRIVKSVSIMETPDFDKYILEKTLVLTTLYPIKNDVDRFLCLLDSLHQKQASGLIVKIRRYIDMIPEVIIDKAKQLGFPIITLEYDANLSLLFDSIIAEVHYAQYSTHNFNALYSTLLQDIVVKPSTKALILALKSIPDIDVLIVNLFNQNIHATSEKIQTIYNDHPLAQSSYHILDDQLIINEVIKYDGLDVYRLMVMTPYEQRHIIYNYIEIIKLMIVLIYQKKQENALKQNQFLMDFVTNMTSNYQSNMQVKEAGKIFNWNITFPIMLMMIDLKEHVIKAHQPMILSQIKHEVVNACHIHESELRLIILNHHVLIIANLKQPTQYKTMMIKLHDTLKIHFQDAFIRAAYSTPIHEASDIPTTYTSLFETLNHATKNQLSSTLIHDHHVRMVNVLKKLDTSMLMEYAHSILKPLIDYENSHDLPLINTYYHYIECQFNAKEAATKLFIHYNSLRYRLNVIESCGYPIFNTKESHFEVYFALTIYLYFFRQKD